MNELQSFTYDLYCENIKDEKSVKWTYVCMSDSQIILSDNPFPVGRRRPSKNTPSIIEIDTLFNIFMIFSHLKIK